MEQKQVWSMGIKDADSVEKIISEKEIKNLSLEKIPEAIYGVFDKVLGNKLENIKELTKDKEYDYDLKDKFTLKSKVVLVYNESMRSGNTGHNFEIEIDLTGELQNLVNDYQETLKKKVSDLNLGPGYSYGIYGMNCDLGLYDKKEEVIKGDTKYKLMVFDGAFVSEGKPKL